MTMSRKTGRELATELATMRECQQGLEACQLNLEQEQVRYHTLLAASPDAMVFVNREGQIIEVNAQLERLFGYEPGELDGRPLEMLVPAQYRVRHAQHVAGFFTNPRQRPMGSSFEIYGVKKDGQEFPADVSLSFLEVDGETFATAAVRDITEKKKAAARLERDYHMQRATSAVLKIALEPTPLADQLQRILEHILSVPQLALEKKGAIYIVDRSEQALVLKAHQGFSESALVPCRQVPLGECLCGKAAQSCAMVFSECADDRHEILYGGAFPHGHYCIPILQGPESVGLINVFVREGHRYHEAEDQFLSVIADTLAGVLRHHRAEAEKKELVERLAASEKMAALGRWTSNFAHEIRNPLTAVGGLTRRLAKKVAASSEETTYIERILEEVGRLEVVLSNMLAYARSYRIPEEEHDLGVMLAHLLEQLAGTCRAQGIRVQADLDVVPAIHIDRQLAEKILANLLANAIEAMPQGGVLKVASTLRSIAAGNFVVIRIQDTGEGIAEENLPLVFEPFFTTKPGKKRTGLGLASTKKIIEAHGGAISVQSRAGEGTLVTLTFPVAPADLPVDFSI
ncbi:MAG: PAS domain S-box protein [Thermodesulfobacteriota bacterium]